ncbi:DUF3126 family protein [Parvularcula sp. LCG005]|uniref:DUF3126 family protein n=1 Tax=Parvularcula sp. LCG005 TaxID=3078805 RepID=UPI002942208A|nr:DUF3126 family protein [Parvularcula sp. LCG005]WOI54036.1 DUF3126 family protein [Parvularcula sp. LCG005]
MNLSELSRLQNFLRKRFNDKDLNVRPRTNKDDSAEVYSGEEFIGVLFRDEDEGEISYDFNMAILDIDLEEDFGNA